MTDKHHQNTSKLIQTARFKMHNNLHKNMDVKLLAAELNVSYPWLRRAFKDIVGVAPGQYHLNIRIEKACKILKETDLTVNEVSYYLGFESEFYFSRIFKKKTGISPGKYRQKS
jgi:AraC-like DNA-binding protein